MVLCLLSFGLGEMGAVSGNQAIAFLQTFSVPFLRFYVNWKTGGEGAFVRSFTSISMWNREISCVVLADSPNP